MLIFKKFKKKLQRWYHWGENKHGFPVTILVDILPDSRGYSVPLPFGLQPPGIRSVAACARCESRLPFYRLQSVWSPWRLGRVSVLPSSKPTFSGTLQREVRAVLLLLQTVTIIQLVLFFWLVNFLKNKSFNSPLSFPPKGENIHVGSGQSWKTPSVC